MKKIKIFDTTLRDGEQTPGVSLTSEEKLIIAEQLKKLNVDVIEAGFPITSEAEFLAVQNIAKKINGPIICGLARACETDIKKCWDAVKFSQNPRIHVFIATSKVHMDKKLKKSKEEICEIVKRNVSYAKSLCEDIEFSPEDSSRTDLNFMIDVIRIAIESGAKTINVPDTVGYAQPEEFHERIKYIFEKLENLISEKNITISVHCHNDLGNAVANSLSAVRAGATQVECAMNGLGERAGNCSLEEFVMNLSTRKEYFQAETQINIKEICKTSEMVSEIFRIGIQPNKAIIGANAFAHEAGIHQHGVLSDKSTYEIMSPESIGWTGQNIVIGKHSGWHAVKYSLGKEKISFDEKDEKKIMSSIKAAAESGKTISKEILSSIVNNINKIPVEEIDTKGFPELLGTCLK